MRNGLSENERRWIAWKQCHIWRPQQRRGSFSAAGRQLDVPLPTISRKLADLEAHVKTQLLVRSGVVCGSPKYFAAHGTPKTPADLADHMCVTFTALAPGMTWIFNPKGGRDQGCPAALPAEDQHGQIRHRRSDRQRHERALIPCRTSRRRGKTQADTSGLRARASPRPSSPLTSGRRSCRSNRAGFWNSPPRGCASLLQPTSPSSEAGQRGNRVQMRGSRTYRTHSCNSKISQT
ncbi:LysR family transcriptional regulator [Allomesorhizobium camelthorni]|uniref:helix-turn-helix domain-containing protein n=1 Tax=Allomesorhizobium camelthorni TaxID=475069 RepID=UPI003CCD21E6